MTVMVMVIMMMMVMMMVIVIVMLMVRLSFAHLDHLLHQLQLRLELQLRLNGLSDLFSSSRSEILSRLDHSVDVQRRLRSHGGGSAKAGCAGEQFEDGGRFP